MSIDAIIVMVMSMIALWGVATTALVYSMRKEDYKLELLIARFLSIKKIVNVT